MSGPATGRNYLLFHQPLLDWIVEQINEQKDTDKWEATEFQERREAASKGDRKGLCFEAFDPGGPRATTGISI